MCAHMGRVCLCAYVCDVCACMYICLGVVCTCTCVCTCVHVCVCGACVCYVSNSELHLGPSMALWPNPAHGVCQLLFVVFLFPAMWKEGPRLFETDPLPKGKPGLPLVFLWDWAMRGPPRSKGVALWGVHRKTSPGPTLAAWRQPDWWGTCRCYCLGRSLLMPQKWEFCFGTWSSTLSNYVGILLPLTLAFFHSLKKISHPRNEKKCLCHAGSCCKVISLHLLENSFLLLSAPFIDLTIWKAPESPALVSWFPLVGPQGPRSPDPPAVWWVDWKQNDRFFILKASTE